jgi:cytochrome c
MDPLEGHERPILALAVSPDGAALATGGVDGAILLWDPAAGAAARVLNAHDGPVWSLAFDPSGRRLFSAGNDGIVRQWDASTGMLLPEGATGPAAVATRVVPADPGERQFRKCVICHTVTPDDGNRAGPTLHRLFGREAGSLPGYAYSPALVDSTIVWTEETVARLFEIGPEALTPGSKMPLQKIQDPADRAALVRYLRRVTEGVP